MKILESKHEKRRFFRRKLTNWFALGILSFIALAAVAPLFFVFTYVIVKGVPDLSLEFFTQIPKPIGEEGGGMANAIVGSGVLILLSSLVGIPWGIAAGIYLAEYKQGLTTKILRFSTDILTGVPSIVIGLFGYAVLVAPMRGYSAYAGGFALSIIMVPIVARITEEMLKLMPDHVREAGLGLGIPRWRVIMSIVVPGCLGGVVTGVMLAIARVAGETAPLLFTAFNNNFGFRGLNQPTASMPVQIFNFAISHDDIWRQKAWTGAMVLVLFVFVLNITTRLYLARRGK